jgi:hypothetical protein
VLVQGLLVLELVLVLFQGLLELVQGQLELFLVLVQGRLEQSLQCLAQMQQRLRQGG